MKILLLLGSVLILASCTHSQNSISATQPTELPSLAEFKLSSPAFKQGDTIPSIYTCDSTNISPALHWTKASGKLASYALIMDDPDAPMGTWVHWVVYNIPATDSSLPASFPKDSILANGTRQGVTSFRTTSYGGPCPPDKMHRYFFRLYALDTVFSLPCSSTGERRLLAAIKGHILAEAELMGKYNRKVKPVGDK